jgi:hypothetical protein
MKKSPAKATKAPTPKAPKPLDMLKAVKKGKKKVKPLM